MFTHLILRGNKPALHHYCPTTLLNAMLHINLSYYTPRRLLYKLRNATIP